MSSAVLKQEKRSLREAIVNYDEIVKVLTGSRWEVLIDDDSKQERR